jgi:hypothetical protein
MWCASATTYLVLEAMACVLQYPDIGGYIIATGDVDFLPLISRLKATGRKVIGMGAEGAIAGSLLQNCDEYICCSADGLVVKDRSAADTGTVVNALRGVFRDCEDMELSEVEQALGRELPGFLPTEYGASSLAHLLGQLRNFVSLHEDGRTTKVVWEGPRTASRSRATAPNEGELSFGDYMHNTRWFVPDAELRDRVLRATFHTLSDGSAMDVMDLRAAVDPDEELADKQWYGTLFSLKCGGGLYEHPDGGEHSLNGRRVSLFRGIEDEDEFRTRYYASLFHKPPVAETLVARPGATSLRKAARSRQSARVCD